jgi:hypothetical protein
MLIESYRLLVIPLCAVALAASAVSAPFDMLVSLIAVLGIALVGFPRSAIVRWLYPSRPLVEVLPPLQQNPEPARSVMSAGTRARTFDEVIDARAVTAADEAADLLRSDDDGGRPIDARAWRRGPR